ncbi:TBC1 domain family member 2B-like isoform X2 [Tigriopus californicus]|uniref:TBC1 domain family member 2B-like isoform X2 n=1 Tax=Tigriopus californicus TaxID=6832 RepID=UPI0027DA0F81|nr:TBC1 domain family member 2B-like isoform X2 [Tigriopus californicus]
MFYFPLNPESSGLRAPSLDSEEGVGSEEGEPPKLGMFRKCGDSGERSRASPLPNENLLKLATSMKPSSSLEFATPPESPRLKLRDCAVTKSEEIISFFSGSPDAKQPVAPPRHKRLAHKNKLERLRLTSQDRSSSQGDEPRISADLLIPDLDPTLAYPPLKGHLSMLVVSAKGLRQIMKTRYFVYDKKVGRLKFYKNEEDHHDLLGEIDIQSATFCYDVQSDRSGEFTICTRLGEHVLSAGTAERRMYWLQQLQKARREFAQSSSNRNSFHSQVGLLKEKTPEEEFTLKESSPFKEIMHTLDRPCFDYTSPPKSADYYKKTSFFQSFAKNKPNFRLPRSASMRTPSPPPGDQRSPPPSKPLSSPSTSFTALTRIRKSMRDKKPTTGNAFSPKRFMDERDRELAMLREDYQASKDEAAASKEVIVLLRKQVDALQKEKDTLTELQKPNFDDSQLLEILRTKDGQIVELESSGKDNQKVIDMQENQIDKLKEEVKTYQQMLEAKDDTVVRLTNHVHEMELKQVVAQSAAYPEVSPGPKLTSNGISFDSDKFEFKEFVDIGVQTDIDKERENLQDTVMAFEMQNKFLNKEVLELNHLRQQATDKEQKLFIESSDWEAKFYQIQSKYLLLLNELHNPQVAVSASRQEMVSQLLKDIVEAAESPTLTTTSASYDRFGFRIDLDSEPSLEDKAERLRRQAEDDSQNMTTELENRESKWEDAIATLESRVPFTLTNDIKRLLRLGIPISQRGAVWKAIVDHKLMRASQEHFPTDYYQKVLSNYNPGQTISPAAKQIELDLLRTLPNNKHYDGPYADGIAKLRRVLLAYSVHNPEVEYCQGFNRIVAIALLFMQEEDAFWLLVYIIEHLMPPEYYSRDKQLIGAQVDQAVLRELLMEKLPKLGTHFANHGVDAGMFTLNWFLCVFVDNIPVKTYLHIWDSFLFEGSKVLFRYAIAIFKFLEEDLLQQTDYMSIFNMIRGKLERLADIPTLTQIAFHELNPFPMRTINHKREHHYKLLEVRSWFLLSVR